MYRIWRTESQPTLNVVHVKTLLVLKTTAHLAKYLIIYEILFLSSPAQFRLKRGARSCTWLIWLTTDTSAGLLWTRSWNFGSNQMHHVVTWQFACSWIVTACPSVRPSVWYQRLAPHRHHAAPSKTLIHTAGEIQVAIRCKFATSCTARNSAVDCGATLQAGRSRVRFPKGYLRLFIDLILRSALCLWDRLRF